MTVLLRWIVPAVKDGGIFGSWKDAYKGVLAEPLKIMQPSELKVGEAEIFTTVKGTKVESFSIKVTNVEKEQFQFELTDSKLLEITGGILQGMSGSPVIQNGKFAGAVTHMFVDEPKKGAGLFLETMRKGEKGKKEDQPLKGLILFF